MKLSLKDKKILTALRQGLPITKRPYKILAQRLNSSEDYVYRRVRLLKKNNFIRYIGPRYNLSALGFKATLVAIRAPKTKIKKITQFLNRQNNITHNYLRKDNLNIWFTLSYKTNSQKVKLIKILQEGFKIERIFDFLPKKRVKLNLDLPI